MDNARSRGFVYGGNGLAVHFLHVVFSCGDSGVKLLELSLKSRFFGTVRGVFGTRDQNALFR